MTITAALVLYSVFWFLTFYIVLQLRTRTQADAGGEVVPGTPQSAAATEDVGRSARIATVYTTVIWGVVVAIILSGWITIEDIDVFNQLDFHKLNQEKSGNP
jgi:predicted secreted protein